MSNADHLSTLAKLDEWERLVEAATPGPWGVMEHCDNMVSVNMPDGTLASFGLWRGGVWGSPSENDSNAHLCATSRTAMPALIALVREQRDMIQGFVNQYAPTYGVLPHGWLERARALLGEP